MVNAGERALYLNAIFIHRSLNGRIGCSFPSLLKFAVAKMASLILSLFNESKKIKKKVGAVSR